MSEIIKINNMESESMPSTETKQPSCLSELVPEVIREIGSFLEPAEAVRLSQTCTSVSTALSLRTHSSLANGSPESAMILGGGQCDGNPAICIGVIIPQSDDSFHSVTLKLNWKDQGRGRRKGQLFVVAQDMPKDVDAMPEGLQQSLRDLPFKKCQTVFQSEFAHHKMSSLQVSICPKPNKIYQIWCKVGPSSSFFLSLRDISVHMTAFGNQLPKCSFYQFQQEALLVPHLQEKVGGWWRLDAPEDDDCRRVSIARKPKFNSM